MSISRSTQEYILSLRIQNNLQHTISLSYCFSVKSPVSIRTCRQEPTRKWDLKLKPGYEGSDQREVDLHLIRLQAGVATSAAAVGVNCLGLSLFEALESTEAVLKKLSDQPAHAVLTPLQPFQFLPYVAKVPLQKVNLLAQLSLVVWNI